MDDAKLTFGELKLGDKFINFPNPISMDVENGYKDEYHIHVKIGDNTGPAQNNAIDLVNGNLSYYPDRVWIVKIV